MQNIMDILSIDSAELLSEVNHTNTDLLALFESQQITVDSTVYQTLIPVLACSPFVQRQALRFPTLVAETLDLGIDNIPWEPAAQLNSLMTQILALDDEAAVMRVLRRFRNQKMMLLAWHDLVGAELNIILKRLSTLAEVLIQSAAAWATQAARKRWGTPRDEEGREQQLIVMAMGKLGAYELNFSSDIDLIFCYPSAGETDGRRVTSNGEFFTRVCQTLVRLLDKQTVDGFVFRVDTRLRPYGGSGALVLSHDAMEIYYQGHAREWERYAMVKARLITGNEEDKASLSAMLTSFVYRRYLDYGVFDSIRVMKRQIEAQLKRKGVEDNVKLGAGGIREIEFIGQAFQLIRGGRDSSLQERGILPVLSLLAEKGGIDGRVVGELKRDYCYLRRLENRIQQIDDKQTHILPTSEIDRQRLVLAMTLTSWDCLVDQTKEVMTRVHGYFDSLIDFAPVLQLDNEADWLELDEAGLTEFLQANEIAASVEIRREIVVFCQSYPVRQLQEKGQQYFIRLMPALLDALLAKERHERTLSAFLQMLEKICNRTVYLVLLVENTQVFEQLLNLAKLSPWIISQVTRSPILLDELIDPDSLFNPPKKAELCVELDQALGLIAADDVEGQMEALRMFKQVNVLRVAAADLTGVIPLMVVSDKLTAIAEVIVEKSVALAWHAVCADYGCPAQAEAETVSGFAVLGFGKMGGLELGFRSDLDMVFLHRDAPIDEMTVGGREISSAEFYTRLSRKLVSLLTTRTFSGPLYEIDLRLRPNGGSGLLVSSESAFAAYQKNKAWTWEHQALIRARCVAGCQTMAQTFERIRVEVLAQARPVAALKSDIITMREKMRTALSRSKQGCFDLKHGVGGIVDIEFIVQFGVLANASRYAVLLSYTDNIRLLLELNKMGFLSDSQQNQLSLAYKTYREASHHASLAEGATLIALETVDEHVRAVSSIWNKIILTN
ncbi:MAG: bifunctional [glutamate--ammonia ligase]-adenylyl-L-tyrosine phosphorylase/[glutamate--ammonia-ligase] adenylyltransferase [Cycloclasticus sp.]